SLKGVTSLARLLAERRGKRNHLHLPPLSYKKILAWADEHFQRTGRWPNINSGPVADAPGENWRAIDNALRQGSRNLRVSSLSRLLARKRGVRNPANPPPLSEGHILQWADAHFPRTGKWPAADSCPIPDAPGETGTAVASARRHG